MDAVPFGADDANVIDRWIDNVCGESVQLPEHRRSQYPAYKEYIRQLCGDNSSSSIFHSSTRSGTREVAALQRALSALRNLHEADALELSGLSAEAASVRHVVGERCGAALDSVSSANGHDPLGAAESRRKLAERYVAGLERKRAARLDKLDACRRRHALLMDQKEQLQKEVRALQETERTVVERFDATVSALAAERAALADGLAWEAADTASDSASAAENISGGDSAITAENVSGGGLAGAAENISGGDSPRALRLSLAAASASLSALSAALSDQDSAHAVRFRQSRQRLKDWQDVVGQRRRLRDQLAAQTRVMGEVVAATAGRLEEERRLGYAGRLQRLNESLFARPAEKLHIRDRDTAHETSARQSPSMPPPSPHTTEGNDDSSFTSSVEERGQGEMKKPRRQKGRRYALLTHLERWEGALLDDIAAMRRTAEKGIEAGEIWARNGNGDGKPSPEMTQALQELRHMLFAEK